jgi:hypothetical protein
MRRRPFGVKRTTVARASTADACRATYPHRSMSPDQLTGRLSCDTGAGGQDADSRAFQIEVG